MRYLLALMAVLALLVNPVAAAAAQVACATSQAMSPMDAPQGAKAAMPGMAHQAGPAAQATADPCCDHSGGAKMDDKACALACASACAVVVALPYTPISLALAYSRAPHIPAPAVWAKPHDPLGLERPPKSIA
jgi:hypothetical protein